MGKGIGIVITERIAVAAVADNAISGPLRLNPEDRDIADSLHGVPAEQIVQRIADDVKALGLKEAPTHVGLGMPGIVRNGAVEDSPNLIQFKGINMQELVSTVFAQSFGKVVPVSVFNDADAMAAGIAATHGHLDRRFLGSGPLGGDARPERALLRLWRAWASGRHYGAARHAAAFHGSGTR